MVLDDSALALAVPSLAPAIEHPLAPAVPRLLAALARPEYRGRVAPPPNLYEGWAHEQSIHSSFHRPQL